MFTNHLGRLLNATTLLEAPRATLKMFANRRDYVDFAYDSMCSIGKSNLITSFCRGKDVLDLGCIDHSSEIAQGLGDDWLHKQIKGVSRSLVELDILDADARHLNLLGYNIVTGNAESFDLHRTFDVIVVGDLIEHLTNVGAFLNCLANHMHDSSIVIITTPNPFNIEQTMLGLFEGNIRVNNEHTMWLDPKVMYELVKRSELRIVDFYWVETRFKLSTRRKIIRHVANGIAELLMRIRPLFRRDYAVLLAKAT